MYVFSFFNYMLISLQIYVNNEIAIIIPLLISTNLIVLDPGLDVEQLKRVIDLNIHLIPNVF